MPGADANFSTEHAVAYRGSSGEYNLAFPLGEGDAKRLISELQAIEGG